MIECSVGVVASCVRIVIFDVACGKHGRELPLRAKTFLEAATTALWSTFKSILCLGNYVVQSSRES